MASLRTISLDEETLAAEKELLEKEPQTNFSFIYQQAIKQKLNKKDEKIIQTKIDRSLDLQRQIAYLQADLSLLKQEIITMEIVEKDMKQKGDQEMQEYENEQIKKETTHYMNYFDIPESDAISFRLEWIDARNNLGERSWKEFGERKGLVNKKLIPVQEKVEDGK